MAMNRNQQKAMFAKMKNRRMFIPKGSRVGGTEATVANIIIKPEELIRLRSFKNLTNMQLNKVTKSRKFSFVEKITARDVLESRGKKPGLLSRERLLIRARSRKSIIGRLN